MNSFAERKVENGAQRYTPQNYSVLVYATIKKMSTNKGESLDYLTSTVVLFSLTCCQVHRLCINVKSSGRKQHACMY